MVIAVREGGSTITLDRLIFPPKWVVSVNITKLGHQPEMAERTSANLAGHRCPSRGNLLVTNQGLGLTSGRTRDWTTGPKH